MEQVEVQLKSRNTLLDILKGIAIILVVLGHSIQYGSGTNYLINGQFYENIFFKIIYSFHMPVFMMISGYLFFYTVEKHIVKKILLDRIKKLIVPIFVWNGLFLFVHFCAHFIHHHIIFHEENDTHIISGLLNYLSSNFQSIWFLWAVFWISLIVVLTNKLFKDSLFVYFLIFTITFILPDTYNLDTYKFMYPFFLFGYFYNKNTKTVNGYILKQTNIYLLPIMIVIYLFLMFFYNQNSYIYISGYTILGKNIANQIYVDVYRLIVGMVGSLLLILIVKNLIKPLALANKNYITKFGVDSLGIYIVSSYFFILLQKLTANLSISFFLIFVETIVILLASYLVVEVFKKKQYHKCIFIWRKMIF